MNVDYLWSVFWTTDEVTQQGIAFIFAIAILAYVLVYLPLRITLFRAARARTKLDKVGRSKSEDPLLLREAMLAILQRSLISANAAEFTRRWSGSQDSSGRAPVRFASTFAQRPLFPTGWRRSLLSSIPGIFLALGILGTFVGLTKAVSTQSNVATTSAATTEAEQTARQVNDLIASLALAFRTSLWGILLSIFFVIVLRRLEGHFEEEEERIDLLVHTAFPWISDSELSASAVREQKIAASELRTSLQDVAMSLENAITAGLERIERTTSDAASGVSDALLKQLSETIKDGVGAHVEALREAISETTRIQEEIGENLALTFEQIRSAADAQSSASASLGEAAHAVSVASNQLSGTASELSPVVERLAQTGDSLEATSGSMAEIQERSSAAAESVRIALEDAKQAIEQQRSLVQGVLGEMHSSIKALSEGLSDDLVKALEQVDGILGNAIGRLSGTIHDSNEMLDRMSPAIGRFLELSAQIQTSVNGVDIGIQKLGESLHVQLEKVPASIDTLRAANSEFVSELREAADSVRRVATVSATERTPASIDLEPDPRTTTRTSGDPDESKARKDAREGSQRGPQADPPNTKPEEEGVPPHREQESPESAAASSPIGPQQRSSDSREKPIVAHQGDITKGSTISDNVKSRTFGLHWRRGKS